MPSIAQLMDFKEKIITESAIQRYSSCNECEEGLILKRGSEDKNLYVFLCSCESGLTRPEKYPLWSDFKHRAANEDQEKEFQKIYGTKKIIRGSESVFTNEERVEMFEMLKKIGSGLIPKIQAKEYAKFVDKQLMDRGVRSDPWKYIWN